MKKAVIFDADDTLWETQVLYIEARQCFVDFLAGLGIDRAQAESRSRKISAALVDEINPATRQKYLYTAARFPESMARTLLSFLPDANPADIEQARAIGRSVFEKQAQPAMHAGDIMAELKQAGYVLIILTKGEEWVQKKRLADFAHTGLADDILIVADKDAQTFLSLVQKHDIDVDRSWSIGDSIEADIRPAQEVGLNTVLLTAQQTWDDEENDSIPSGTRFAADLAEALDIIRKTEREKTMEKTEALKEKLKQAWEAATSSDPVSWTPDNPSWGQCAVTACIVQDELGGDILWAEAVLPGGATVSHYFNLVDGQEEDLTRSQFPPGTVIPAGRPKEKGFPSTRNYVLSNENTAARYRRLKEKIGPSQG